MPNPNKGLNNFKVPQGSSGQAQNPLQNMFDPNSTNNLMQMAQQMAQNIPQNEKDKIDINTMVDQVTNAVSGIMGNTGNSVNSDMQEDLKKMTKTVFSTLLTGSEDNTQPVANSRIDIPGQTPLALNQDTRQEHIQKFKEPKRPPAYEELDDDEEVDVFKPRTPDITINLDISLEDFYNGREKKFAIPRKRIKKNGKKQIVVEEKRKIVVPIEPGMRDEQVIRYNKQASELPGYETGDIVITLRENGHNYFEREGDNLFVVKNISLYESFAAAEGLINLTVRTLNSVYLKLDAKGGPPLHTEDGLRKVIGQGMPFYKKEGFGDLYIKFNLLLPEKLSVENIKDIKHICPPIDKENIIYNDGTKGGISESNTQVVTCKLDNVTEEDLDKLDYEDYSDSDSDESEYSGSEESEYSSEQSEEPEEPYKPERKNRYGRKK